MKRTILAIAVASLLLFSGSLLSAFVSHPHIAAAQFNPAPLQPFIATTSPNVGITQRVLNTPLVITGLTAGLCLTTDANHKVITTTCGSGGGGASGLATSSLVATYPLLINVSASAVTFSTAFGTTTANTYSQLQILSNGLLAVGSSTVNGVLHLPLANGGLGINAGAIYSGATTTAGTGLTNSGNAFNVNTTQNITTLSNLTTAGTINTTASGVLYSTGTSTPTVSAPLTYSGTLGQFVGGVSGAFACTNASAGVTGCLTGTDWNTFNGKQAAGNYITALTGDVTATGPNSVAATIAANAVTYAKFQQVAANSLVGNPTGATANAQAVATSSLFQNASATLSGLLTSTDWNTFNNKQATLTVSWPQILTGSTLSFGGLSTSSALVQGGALYATGVNTLASTPTTTASCSGSASCTPFVVFGSSPVTISATGGGGASTDFTYLSNFNKINAATSSAIWAQGGVNSSSTVQSVGFNVDIFGAYQQGGTNILLGSSTPGLLLVGQGAGASLIPTTTSPGNTAIGINALTTATSSRFMTAVGFEALKNAIDYATQRDTAVGYQAAKQLTTATQVTAIGAGALSAITTGPSNTAIGFGALAAITGGFQNVAVGTGAGTLVTGSNNTLLGMSVGSTLTSGGNNVLIGSQVDVPTSGTSNYLNIQNILYGTGNSATGNTYSTGQFGIGSSSPYARLSINANAGDTNQTLFAIGSSTATATTTQFVVMNTGKVGIGTAAPGSSDASSGTAGTTGVDVANGDVRISAGRLNLSTIGNNAEYLYSPAGSGVDYWGARNDLILQADNDNNTAGTIVFATGNSGANTTGAKMTLSNAGFLGIGTTSPYSVLSVVGSSGVVADHYTATSTTASLFQGGFQAFASSTIGNGAQIGGLTISGGATTTGNASVLGVLNVGPTQGGGTGDVRATRIVSDTFTSLSSGAPAFSQSIHVSNNSQASYFTGTDGSGNALGVSTTSPYATLAVGGSIVVGASTAGGTLGDLTIAKLGTAAGTFIAADPTGKLIATTTPTGSASLTGTTGQTAYFSATNSAVGTSSLFISNNGQVINKNGDVLANQASAIVSTSTATGQYTTIQAAVDALGSNPGLIHVRCGTFTLPSGNNGITYKANGQIIQGEGLCTQLNMDKANTNNAVGWNVSGITNTALLDVYIHQTNATFGGIGVAATNTPIFVMRGIKMDGFATSTYVRDSANQSFYMHFSDMDLRDNTTCYDLGSKGNPTNDNVIDGMQRCAPHSGNNGFGYYFNSSSVNGAQAWHLDNPNVEPTGAATGLTGMYFGNAVDITVTNAYVEGLATGWNITSGAQRINFIGGEFISNTSYTNAGSAIQFLGVDKESIPYNLIMASSTIQSVSANDASSPLLSFINNTNFAQVGDFIKIAPSNGTDSGNGINIIYPGTGAGLRISASGLIAATTTGKVFMHGLTVTTSGNAVCDNVASNEIENGGASACVVSSQKAKHDIQAISESTAQEVMQLQPVQYLMNDTGEARYGFIAEDTAKIDPKLVEYAQADTYVTGQDGKPVLIKKGEPLTVDYQRSTGLFVAFSQYEQREIEALQAAGGHAKRSAESNWMWIVMGLLGLAITYQQVQIRRLKK